MIRRNPSGDYPKIHKTSYIDPSAVIIGQVTIGKNVFVGPGAVMRADETKSSISISDGCNVQDRVIIHALGNSSVIIGEKTSLSHGCIVHGPCKIGQRCFIGFGSVVFNSCLAEGVFVQFLAVVSGVTIPQGRIVLDGMVINTKQKVMGLRIKTVESKCFAQRVVKANRYLLKGYKREA